MRTSRRWGGRCATTACPNASARRCGSPSEGIRESLATSKRRSDTTGRASAIAHRTSVQRRALRTPVRALRRLSPPSDRGPAGRRVWKAPCQSFVHRPARSGSTLVDQILVVAQRRAGTMELPTSWLLRELDPRRGGAPPGYRRACTRCRPHGSPRSGAATSRRRAVPPGRAVLRRQSEHFMQRRSHRAACCRTPSRGHAAHPWGAVSASTSRTSRGPDVRYDLETVARTTGTTWASWPTGRGPARRVHRVVYERLVDDTKARPGAPRPLRAAVRGGLPALPETRRVVRHGNAPSRSAAYSTDANDPLAGVRGALLPAVRAGRRAGMRVGRTDGGEPYGSETPEERPPCPEKPARQRTSSLLGVVRAPNPYLSRRPPRSPKQFSDRP